MVRIVLLAWCRYTLPHCVLNFFMWCGVCNNTMGRETPFKAVVSYSSGRAQQSLLTQHDGHIQWILLAPLLPLLLNIMDPMETGNHLFIKTTNWVPLKQNAPECEAEWLRIRWLRCDSFAFWWFIIHKFRFMQKIILKYCIKLHLGYEYKVIWNIKMNSMCSLRSSSQDISLWMCKYFKIENTWSQVFWLRNAQPIEEQ